MTLPPITAQIIDIPTAITDLGAVAIIALALLGVVYAIRPLIVGFVDGQKQLAAVNRELLLALTASDRAIDRSADEAKATREAVRGLETALMRQTEALMTLVKAQPAAITQVGAALTDRLNVHDAAAAERYAKIETDIASLRDMISSGHRAYRAEVLAQLNAIMEGIASLKPPPPPMHIVKPPEPLERQDKTA